MGGGAAPAQPAGAPPRALPYGSKGILSGDPGYQFEGDPNSGAAESVISPLEMATLAPLGAARFAPAALTARSWMPAAEQVARALGGAAFRGGIGFGAYGAGEDVIQGKNPLPNMPGNVATGAVVGPLARAAMLPRRGPVDVPKLPAMRLAAKGRVLPAAAAALGENAPPAVVAKLTQAIRQAGPVRKEQEALYSAERSRRVGQGAAMLESGRGEAAFRGALGSLKGELPKAEFAGVRDLFTPDDIDKLHNIIIDSKLPFFQKITAQSGLQKLLGVQGGVVPQTSELKVLRDVYGPDFVEAALAQRPKVTQAVDALVEAANIPRSIMSSFDLSAPFRQGLFMVSRPQFWQGWSNMVKSFGSDKVYQATQQEIGQRPTIDLMRRAGLALTDVGGAMVDREEKFLSNYAERIPLVGRGIRASGRAYTSFLTKLRADVFDDIMAKAKAAGHDVESDRFLNGLGSYINAATGRGPLAGSLEKAAPALNAVLFSPRLFASRIALLSPTYYAGLPAPVRREALRDLIALGGLATSVMSLSAMGGAEVGADPRNADFAKIRVGNTRYDLLGGFQQPIRLAAQLATGQVISSTTGRTIRLNDVKGYRPLTRKDIVLRFLQSKENPIASFVSSWLEGRDFEGKPFNLPKEVMDRLYPMALGDVIETVKEMGPLGIAASAPGIFGLGVQTYGPRISGPGGQVNLKAAEAADFEKELREASAAAEADLHASGLLQQLSEQDADRRLEKLVESRQAKVRRRWQARMGVLNRQPNAAAINPAAAPR
jgi:hypothetical protein